MAATLVQSATGNTPGTTESSLDVALSSSVTSGNTIVVCIANNESLSRTFTVSDSQSNSYTLRKRDVLNGRVVEIWSAETAKSGSTTITVTPSAATHMVCAAAEITASTIESSDSFQNPSSGTFYFAEASGFSPPADTIVFSVGTFNASPGTITGNVDYTTLVSSSANPIGHIAYRETSSELTNERGEITAQSTLRNGPGAIAAFAPVAGGSSPVANIIQAHQGR